MKILIYLECFAMSVHVLIELFEYYIWDKLVQFVVS